MYVCWLDEIEDFRFDVTHLPGSRNQADPLTRHSFADGLGLPRQGTQTLRVSRSCFHGWGMTRRARRHWPFFRQGGQRTSGQRWSGLPAFRRGMTAPPQGPRGGGASPPCTSMFVALAGSWVALETGTMVPSDDHFLAPAFIQSHLAGGGSDARQASRQAWHSHPLRLAGPAWRGVRGAMLSAVP
jgi:hypothetical protein